MADVDRIRQMGPDALDTKTVLYSLGLAAPFREDDLFRGFGWFHFSECIEDSQLLAEL